MRAHYIILLFILCVAEMSFATKSWWRDRQASFEENIAEYEKRKAERMKLRKSYLLEKEDRAQQKYQQRFEFLNQRLPKNHEAKAEKVFQTYIQPEMSDKNLLKKKFIDQKIKESQWKEKHKIPLEQQIFL